MEKINGGRAFPQFEVNQVGMTEATHTGMSLRDYSAGQALIGILRRTSRWNEKCYVAKLAYSQADAMLEERMRDR